MVDRDFGHWLAGFIDGEGCFYITRDRTRAPYRARFTLTVRADDHAIVRQCHAYTGLGSVHQYRAGTGNMMIRWNVQSHVDCGELVKLLQQYPLRAKKSKDFEVWSRAVALSSTQIKLGRKANNIKINEQMLGLKEELKLVRREGLDA